MMFETVYVDCYKGSKTIGDFIIEYWIINTKNRIN